MSFIGRPTNRVDGRAKVTGAARYAAEYQPPSLAYGFVVSSQFARGRILKIDATEALALPGVLQVLTHENTPRLARSAKSYQDDVAPPGAPFRPLHGDQVYFCGQPIALVVADSFELARFAASLVHVKYSSKSHATDLERKRRQARLPKPRSGITPPPPPRGRPSQAWAKAAVQLTAEYRVPVEHHNPMEPFATTVVRDEDGKLTIYDKTQGVQNVQRYLCNVFGCPTDHLRVLSPFVGGAFGSGLRPQYQVFLAVLAARELKRSVRVCLTRQQMFTLGYRPATWQRVALGASSQGQLQAIIHDAVAGTSRFEDYSEPVLTWSGMLYQCPNVKLRHQVVPLDLCTPCDMRAPGAAWGVYALECAMDELAVKLQIDPVELRLKNYAARDQNEDLPFSSKELRECYRQGMASFGWAKRDPKPGSMRRGNSLIGWGMATGVWEAMQQKASAKAILTADGKLTVSSATADIGTGTYTIMTQLAADLLGLPLDCVTFKLGDSSLPTSPVEGGSWTASTIGSAVHAVCEQLRRKLFHLAQKTPRSPLAKARYQDIQFADGQIRPHRGASRAVSLTAALRHADRGAIESESSTGPSAQRSRYSCHAHSAVFAEVNVDQDLGTVHVSRLVNAVAGGRILNPKTARSQIMGGAVWGIGMALEEESILDHGFGKFMNANLAEYHVAVNADIRNVEVLFVEEQDEIVNPLGAKGLGELGVVGVAAAIANAVFHATGHRIRDLPITPDKVLKAFQGESRRTIRIRPGNAGLGKEARHAPIR